jgi:hypothetical protein
LGEEGVVVVVVVVSVWEVIEVMFGYFDEVVDGEWYCSADGR